MGQEGEDLVNSLNVYRFMRSNLKCWWWKPCTTRMGHRTAHSCFGIAVTLSYCMFCMSMSFYVARLTPRGVKWHLFMSGVVAPARTKAVLDKRRRSWCYRGDLHLCLPSGTPPALCWHNAVQRRQCWLGTSAGNLTPSVLVLWDKHKKEHVYKQKMVVFQVVG